MVQNKDFRLFIELLNAHKIKYLVVGGYAVKVHGYPRYTNDMDIWLWIDKTNVEKLIKASGLGSLNINVDDFTIPNHVIQLGYPPNRIDLFTSISGVEFDECYPKKATINIAGIQVDFIDIESLKKNKKASGRHKDLNDLENLG